MKITRWCVVLVAMAGPALAQDRQASINLQSVFYGDNTEFIDNAYRDGETLLGVNNRLALDVWFKSRARLSLGVFSDHRAGGDAFQTVKPIVSLRVSGKNDAFMMGTLDSANADLPARPEQVGPHHLLPLLEVDTLSFTRAYEAGLQWTHLDSRVDQDAWINWQQLNTAEHREKFDTGLRNEVKVGHHVFLGVQGHIVHEGGQLYDVGPVKDDFAGAAGLGYRRERTAFLDATSAELYLFRSQYWPTRADTDSHRTGRGQMLRIIATKGDWRLAFIRARSKGFAAVEGDPNYGALLNDGHHTDGHRSFTSAHRRYEEVSLARAFHVTPGVRLDVAFRQYWVDGDSDYSYRVLAVVNLRHMLGKF